MKMSNLSLQGGGSSTAAVIQTAYHADTTMGHQPTPETRYLFTCGCSLVRAQIKKTNPRHECPNHPGNGVSQRVGYCVVCGEAFDTPVRRGAIPKCCDVCKKDNKKQRQNDYHTNYEQKKKDAPIPHDQILCLMACGCQFPRSFFGASKGTTMLCPEHGEKISKIKIHCVICGKERYTRARSMGGVRYCEDCVAKRQTLKKQRFYKRNPGYVSKARAAKIARDVLQGLPDPKRVDCREYPKCLMTVAINNAPYVPCGGCEKYVSVEWNWTPVSLTDLEAHDESMFQQI